jgi:hypothetical protein
MKSIVNPLLMILAFAMLALFVFAQSQTGREQNPNIRFGSGPYVQGNGVRSPEKGIILLKTVFREDGTLQGFQTMPPGSNPEPVLTSKIRIEMQNGSVQEIELSKVKKISIE